MVSNLNPENMTKETKVDVANQTQEEILDYLMGGSVDNPQDAVFHSLTYNRLKRTKAKVITRKIKRTATKHYDLKETFYNAVLATKKASQAAMSKVSTVDLSNIVFTAKGVISFLHNTEIPLNIDLSKESRQKVKDNTFKMVNNAQTLMVTLQKLLKTMFETHLPSLRHSFISTMLLIGCTMLAFMSNGAISKGNILSERNLAPVNWNVNGQISELEKESISDMLINGNIKVLAKANIAPSKVELITSTDSLSNKHIDSNANMMVVSSNTLQHKVANGESILVISKKYRVSISDLISANPDVDLINLKNGELLAIPNTSEVRVYNDERPSSIYSKIPRSYVASRSLSANSRFIHSKAYGMLWPVPGSQNISSPYGPRAGGFHPGIDVAAPTGMNIVASKDGTVVMSGWAGGYGKCVLIDHGNGIKTRYGHNSSLIVSTGQKVKAGQVIAKLGSTGWSTGPHLHYEVLINGKHNNPLNYIH